MPHMATMPRNMVTLATKSLPNDLHSEPKWNGCDVKNRLRTDFKTKMQNKTLGMLGAELREEILSLFT